ncbi:helix-turn-helix domain-containing protein [Streptomyces sp. PKU-MA01144]|uniref:helix-turn-helix domain-containing protein n=1 Tax=Streptomyces sp. PKU-MA01144 TaxID=2729138 RepID=UPI00147A71F9|nr:helix-turn-helix domain-containing protein [Streptomyces sp. PKU-MA01144]NNJ04134.1 helix-turn-helix domain-containing protein [Streptomyces sp. PKU-MA01144]
MNTTTAATQAHVTVATIRTWCRRGVIAAAKVAGKWVIDTASLAHRIAIGTMKTPKKPAPKVVYSVETMTAIGGRRWQRGNMDRVYLNDYATVPGLELDHYNTGSISGAALDGSGISNAEGGRLATAVDKVYFDATDGKVYIKWGWGNPRSLDRDEIAARIFGAVRAAITAL